MNAPTLAQQTRKAGWSPAEAFLGILTLIAVWDGQKAAQRLEAVHFHACRSLFLRPFGEKGRIQLHQKVVERMGAAHDEALSEACAALPPTMGASVYATCIDVLSAAGALSESDRSIIAQLRPLLHVDEMLAAQIETIILLKNRY